MKKLLVLSLVSVLILSACENAAEPAKTITATDETGETVELVLPSFESSRETTTTSASSELEDNTGWGFAYNSANVLDLDYSTAWCPSGEELPSITLSFPEPTTLGAVGIVPGFARDEEIFFQNNRLKTVEVWVDDNAEAMAELSFEDAYEMQFFDLPEMSAETLTFKVMETYPGSKYNDTCIAEIDLWSDWVKTKDATAAHNYYMEHKEAFALRPISVVDAEMIFAHDYYDITPEELLTTCGALDSSAFSKEMRGNAYLMTSTKNGEYLGSYDGTDYNDWGAGAGMTPILSAQLGSGATEDDLFTIKWIQTSFFMQLDTPRLVRSVVVNPKTCADGSLYISDVFEQAGMGGSTLQILHEGRLIYTTTLGLYQ